MAKYAGIRWPTRYKGCQMIFSLVKRSAYNAETFTQSRLAFGTVSAIELGVGTACGVELRGAEDTQLNK